MTDASSSDEQRNFRRIPFDARVEVESAGKRYPAELLDISLKGALVRLPAEHGAAPGQTGAVYIHLSDDQHIHMQATVAHVEERRAGFRCDHIDVDSITHLARIVELNTGDPELLHRELSALGTTPDRD